MPNSLIAHAIGHLTRDWKTGTTQTGTKYASNSIAVNTEKDKAMFINLVAWGKHSENLDSYSSKGSAMYVCGRLSEHEYEGKKSLHMNVSEFQFLGDSKKKDINGEIPF